MDAAQLDRKFEEVVGLLEEGDNIFFRLAYSCLCGHVPCLLIKGRSGKKGWLKCDKCGRIMFGIILPEGGVSG